MRKTYCVACGEKEELHHHHLLPRSKGGTDEEGNIITLCIECHGIMHDTSWSNNHAQLVREGIDKAKQSGVKLGPKKKPLVEPIEKYLEGPDQPIAKAIFCLVYLENIQSEEVFQMTWGELVSFKDSYHRTTQKMIEQAERSHEYSRKYFSLPLTLSKQGPIQSANTVSQKISRMRRNLGVKNRQAQPFILEEVGKGVVQTEIRCKNREIMEENKRKAANLDGLAKRLIDTL
jgi:hypothetical protein